MLAAATIADPARDPVNFATSYLAKRDAATGPEGQPARQREHNEPYANILIKSSIDGCWAYCSFRRSSTLRLVCDANDFQGIDDLVMKAAFVTRIPAVIEKQGEDSKAPNILGQIDKMVKRVPTFRDSYDHLSDVVHPNGLGAVIYFSQVKYGMITFANDAVNPRRSIELLYLSAVQLAFVEAGLGEIDERLPKVSAAFTEYAEDFIKRITPDGPVT